MWSILTGLFFVLSIFAAEEVLQEEIKSEQGQYSVRVEPKNKKVEIKKVDGGAGAPHMRVRILRKNDRPIELRLHTLSDPNVPPTYFGKIDHWNESHVGLELEVSFDKKTWKKIGSALKKIVP